MNTGKYIITEYKPKKELPKFRQAGVAFPADAKKNIIWLDDSVVKGAFYVECVWYLKSHEEYEVETHTHDFDEVIGFFGTDTNAPEDLGGEVEYWIDGQKHLLTKSCLIFVPRGIKHCPQRIVRLDRPIFHFTAGTGSSYD